LIPERFLSEEDAAWRMLRDVFDRIPDERFEEPTLAGDGWSAKDVMFHLAGWMDDCGEQLERMWAGRFDPDDETRESIERRNLEWFEVSRTLRVADVRDGFAAARRRMREVFGTMDVVTPDAIAWFEESGALHYEAHARDLRSWLGGDAP
jgi:hypothetical protein